MPKEYGKISGTAHLDGIEEEITEEILETAYLRRKQKKRRFWLAVMITTVSLGSIAAFLIAAFGHSKDKVEVAHGATPVAPSYSIGGESESFKILEAEDGSKKALIDGTIDSHTLRFKNLPLVDGFFDVGKGWCLNFAQDRVHETVMWDNMGSNEDGTMLCKSSCEMDALCIGYMTHKTQCAQLSTKDPQAASGIYLADGDRDYHCYAKQKDLHRKFIFRFSEVGSADCPRGFTFITDQKMCHEAADFLQTRKEFDEDKYEKQIGANNMVGCFRSSQTQNIHFNEENQGKKVDDHQDQYVCVLKEDMFEEKKSKKGASGRAGPTNENVLCSDNRKFNGGVQGSDDMCLHATGDGRIMMSDCDRTCIQTRCEDDDACAGWEEHMDFFRPVNSIEWVYGSNDWITIEKKTDALMEKCLERKGNSNFRFLSQGDRFPYSTCKEAVDEAEGEDICQMTYLEYYKASYEINEATWRNLIAPNIEPHDKISSDCPCSCGEGEFLYADRPTKPPVPTYAPSPRGGSKQDDKDSSDPVGYHPFRGKEIPFPEEGYTYDHMGEVHKKWPEYIPDFGDKFKGVSLNDRLDILKMETEKMQKVLLDYYTFDPPKKLNGSQIMEHTFYMGPDDPDSTMSDHYGDFLDVITDRFVRAFVYDRKFKVGTIGSSVAAGHDNCAYDAYQMQLNRIMQPVFEAAGFQFECVNAGMKGDCQDNHVDQTMCFTHTVGTDIDSIHYSWTYFQHGDFYSFHERLIRWAALLPKVPFTAVINTETCKGMRKDMKKKSGDLPLIARYGPTLGYNKVCMQGSISSFQTFYTRMVHFI